MKQRKGVYGLLKYWRLVLFAAIVCFLSPLLFCIGTKNKQEAAVIASSVISTGDFRLNAENSWDTTAKASYADLDWDEVADLSNKGYTLYQSEGASFSKVSTNYNKSIKVLNVYPDIAASNTLKTWMDGLGLTDGNGDPLINVTPIAFTTYNANSASYLKDSAGNYQYDVVMFGSYDVYGTTANDLSTQSKNELISYIEAGYGVLLGHDTAYAGHPNFLSIGNTYLGIVNNPANAPSLGSTTVQIVDNGYLMKYPFEMADNLTMTIPLSHSTQVANINKARIWLEFRAPYGYGGPAWTDGTYTNNFYVATSNTHENLAMIQTGHSGGTSTEDERKILANVLYNLAQLTRDAYAADYTIKDDQAPAAPTPSIRCGEAGKLNIKVDTEDRGKEYQWYVEAAKKDGSLLKSDVVSEVITSNIAGYFYEVTDSASSTLKTTVEGYKDAYGRIPESSYDVYVAPDSNAVVYDTAGVFTISEARTSNRYLHIVAVDRANNVSLVSTTELDDLLQYVDFEVERTGDEAKLVELNLDASLDSTQKSVEVQIPTHTAIKNFDSLTLPTDWYAFENSETADYRSFTFAMENNNALATIQAFLEDLRFSIEAPADQSGTIRLVFHEKVYTSYEHEDGTTHYYTFVTANDTWFHSYNEAKKMTYKNLTGYLATLTSEEEHDFVYETIAKKAGWLGGSRGKLGTMTINDHTSISTNTNDYDITGDDWYWVNGPEAGQVFYKGKTKVTGSGVSGMYTGWAPNEPNNNWLDSRNEYSLQFALKDSSYDGKLWNDLPGDLVDNEKYNSGYYVEFSAYGDQVEGSEITDVCWAAAIPQKVSLKAYDEAAAALIEGDQLFDQELRIGKAITVIPNEIAMHDFIKLTNLDDTVHGLSYTVSGEVQQGKLIYANRTVTVHLRQLIANGTTAVPTPSTGYGKLLSQNSLGLDGQEYSITMLSSDNSISSFSDYVLKYDVDNPMFTYKPTIPEYYQLLGYVVTTSDSPHDSSASTMTPIAVDVSQHPEFWLTIYLEPSQETPGQFSWDYKENKLGTIAGE